MDKWRDDPGKGANRKQQRRDKAEQRQRLKPLRDRIRQVEQALAAKRSRLAELEARLADETLYTDSGRQEELAQLARDQAAVRSSIEALEGEWLEASEELERAS